MPGPSATVSAPQQPSAEVEPAPVEPVLPVVEGVYPPEEVKDTDYPVEPPSDEAEEPVSPDVTPARVNPQTGDAGMMGVSVMRLIPGLSIAAAAWIATKKKKEMDE